MKTQLTNQQQACLLKQFKRITASSLLAFSTLSPLSTSAQAEELPTTYQYKMLSIEMAQKAVWQAMLNCREKGYSVAVAIVDRGGNLQAFARDQFAGPHTPETAQRKAWTANSFRVSTGSLANLLKRGVFPNQVQHNQCDILVGGGEVIKINEEITGGIGSSVYPSEVSD